MSDEKVETITLEKFNFYGEDYTLGDDNCFIRLSKYNYGWVWVFNCKLLYHVSTNYGFDTPEEALSNLLLHKDNNMLHTMTKIIELHLKIKSEQRLHS